MTEKKKFIICSIVLSLVIVFSVYEIVILSIDLANYSLEMARSKAGIITGIVLFGIIVLIAAATLGYIIYQQYYKKFYRLKK